MQKEDKAEKIIGKWNEKKMQIETIYSIFCPVCFCLVFMKDGCLYEAILSLFISNLCSEEGVTCVLCL